MNIDVVMWWPWPACIPLGSLALSHATELTLKGGKVHSDVHDQVGSHGERVGFHAQHKNQARTPKNPPTTLSGSAWAGRTSTFMTRLAALVSV